jgi:hypothetical protein
MTRGLSSSPWETWFPVFVNLALSVAFYFSTVSLIPKLTQMFVNAKLYGLDLNKKTKEKV